MLAVRHTDEGRVALVETPTAEFIHRANGNRGGCGNHASMSNPRYLLIPEVASAERGPKHPVVRRYSLARFDHHDPRSGRGRFEYLKHTHD